MAKATKPLGGAAKDKYLRELIGSAGLDAEAAKSLTEAARAEIAQLRVRLPLPERAAQRAGKAKPAKVAPAAAASPAASTPSAAPPVPTQPAAATVAAEAAAFDPYAFSAIVVLKRKGRDELEKLLAAVTEPAQLKLIAEKQHLGLPPEAKTASELRSAIVAAAEARIADRRAAAS